MDRSRLETLLERVRARELSVQDAVTELRLGPSAPLDFATLDLHRAVRRGFPEVIFGPGKTTEQIVRIVEEMLAAGQIVLATRVEPDVYPAVRRVAPSAVYHPVARALVVGSDPVPKPRPGVAVVTAGTSDLPVAEEAAITAETMGHQVRRFVDVGVAGIHRLMDCREDLLEARVIVVVAGMEGALPSVVAGLTACPVIGVPTSTGYGVAADGRPALMAMLSSCAAGVTVVNVDNGFGAGYAAALVNQGSADPPIAR